ncbi:MAG TPA: choice-of-anchor Q domain-containing protein [Vicinamibacterales bacterium]|nr:choice-of-anchor Q domain-containing protein [Vicinamibacterales bacterium]
MLNFRTLQRALLGVAVAAAVSPFSTDASTLYVAPGGVGNGTSSSPFGRIADALAVAVAGDTVLLKPGVYSERVRTVRGGTSVSRLVIRAETDGKAILSSAAGNVVRVSHPYVTIRGLVVDGQYGPYDAVLVDSAATSLILQYLEVKRSSKDCIDIRATANVVVEQSLIHHCLNAANGRTDAHGIVAGAVRNLVVRDTRIHSFSGDAIQLDPGRTAPGWNLITIDRCKFWLEPLPTAENGFPVGTVPGENALDTKTLGTAPRAKVIVRQTEAWGFRGGLISNMAAFNVKENVDATFDGVTVSRSEIAFRLRGPGSNGGAWARVQNAVVYDVGTAVRYEDNIERVQVWNSTFGSAIPRFFRAASSTPIGLDVRNVLFLGSNSTMPGGLGNVQATAAFFLNAAAHDYRLASSSLAINAGASISSVTKDRIGVSRPQGAYWDVGAYEFVQ